MAPNSIPECLRSIKETYINGFLPLAAQKLAVDADQQGSDPKDEKHIDKILLIFWIFADHGHGYGEEETDDHGSPEVPLLQIVYALFSVLR